MNTIKFLTREALPLEMHKVRIVQKLTLPPIENRLKAIEGAGNNTFLLKNKDIFLDMLTDSGVNAMSDDQLAAMMQADDSYAGSATYDRLEAAVHDFFGTKHMLPAHQGRACENILAMTFVKPGSTAVMNYHFTTTKAHITRVGGKVAELICAEGTKLTSDEPFKGNLDIDAFKALIKEEGADNISFLRLEAGTNLIGGQPFSLDNAKEACAVAKEAGILRVLDASLLQDNLFFMKTRDEKLKDVPLKDIVRELSACFDIIYFSARKLGFAKGGVICTFDEKLCLKMKELVPMFEGFLTYGGMSTREMEAIAVGMRETLDMDIISQGPQFIEYMTNALVKQGVPVVTPGGGLGCHLNAREFLPHVSQSEYPAGALAAALYIASGVRGMERGTISEQREADGSEHFAAAELVRLALPRRVFTLSQVEYTIDRIVWLYKNRNLIGGLTFTEEPSTLRFFFGRLKPVSDWQEKLVARFREDFGESL